MTAVGQTEEGSDSADGTAAVEDTGNPELIAATGELAAPAARGNGPSADKRIEIDLLTYKTILEIADAVGAACADKIAAGLQPAPPPLFVATPDGARAIGNVQLLDTTLRALLKTLTDMEKTLGGGPSTADLATRTQELAPMAFVAGAKSFLTEASLLLGGVKDLLALLAVTDSYDSQTVAIDPDLLATVVAARCLQHNLAPVVIATGQPLPPVWHRSDLLPKLVRAIAGLRASKPAAPEEAASIETLLSRADAAVDALGQTNSVDPLALMHVLSLHPAAPVLIVRPVAAGGRYRTRKHLFTVLGLAETQSFSVGVAISYTLSDRQTGALMAGDLIFSSSGNLRLPVRVSRTWLNNIKSRH